MNNIQSYRIIKTVNKYGYWYCIKKTLFLQFPFNQHYFPTIKPQQTIMQQPSPTTDSPKDKSDQQGQPFPIVKKKPKLLKKKKLPPTKLFSNIDLKHVINIGDVCFVNQESLRHPDSSEETLLKTLYHYKMISKVTLNSSIVNIELKKNQDNYLPPQYFFQRLRSFGDQTMAKIADHLQNIHQQFTVIKERCQIKQKTFASDNQQLLLNNFLRKMEGKKFFLYFSQITPERINMKNVIFSIPLLQALGCNIKNIAMEFLKYKHVFFQVFTAKNYRFFVDQCLQNFGKIQAKLMHNPNISQQQRQQITSFSFLEEIIRQKQSPQGIYEEVSNAKVRWYSPHPSICCFEVLEIDEANGFLTRNKRKIVHFEQSKPEEELEQLRKIGVNEALLLIESEPEKKMLTQQAASGRSSESEMRNGLKRNGTNDCIGERNGRVGNI